jgi:hypothetical protein
MTEEEYLRMKNILNAIIEQHAVFEENHRKAEARMTSTDNRMTTNAEAITALLVLAQKHAQERAKANEQMNTRFQQIAATFEEIAKKSAETDVRINALPNVVERNINKTKSPVTARIKRTERTLRSQATRQSGAEGHRIVTATLPRRQCRVQFMIDKRPVHTSRPYDSGNTWANIIRFARSKRGGAPANLPRAAVAQPQVFTSGRWINVNE